MSQTSQLLLLMAEAMAMYFLVLASHSLRNRFGPVHFYALIGGITATMSWITDAGLSVQLGTVTFMVGSTVFYTSLLLGVFVVYVFDGPRATRVTISTVVGVSAMMPVIAAVMHLQTHLIGQAPLLSVPLPSLRINAASIIATLLDLVFLAIAWEFLGKKNIRFGLGLRTWLTLLGVMWLDVLLFATLAFAGTPQFIGIVQGTLISRFFVSLLALPFLYGYIHWQSSLRGLSLENRPVLAILRQVTEIEAELTQAQAEIERRKRAEAALLAAQKQLIQQERLAAVGQLTAGMAHNFNNILTGMLLRTSMLHMKADCPDLRKELAEIQGQTEDAARLVGKLLDYSSKALIRPVRLDLGQVVQDQMAKVDIPASIQVQLDLPPAPLFVMADQERMAEVIANLVQNSVEAMPDGGVLTVGLGMDVANGHCVACHKPISGQWLRLTVTDTGSGIDAATFPHIFEPFFTTDATKHSGLGLSQVMGIVSQHHGHTLVDHTSTHPAHHGTQLAVLLPPLAE